MKLFKKKTEETAQSDVLDIEKLLTGDRKPVKPAKKPLPTQPMPTQKLLIVFGGAGLVLVFALITMIVAISVGRRTDPDFGFRDLFVPTTASPTQQTTTEPATLSTPPATTLPAVKPTERPTKPTEPPTEPTEPPIRFDWIKSGDITYIVPSKTLELSLWQYYCTIPSLPIPEDDAPAEDWILLFYSLLSDDDSWYRQASLSFFSSPEQINMDALLRRGIAQDATLLGSYPEAQWLLGQGFDEEDYIFRLPKSDINSLVGVYFGTTFEDHAMPGYRYNEQTGCYYVGVSTAYTKPTTVLGIKDVTLGLEDDTILVEYVTTGHSGAELRRMVLRPVGDHLQIVSNLPAPTEPMTVDLANIPDLSGFVYEPGMMFVEGGYSGYAQWGGSNEFSIELPLLVPFCEGAIQINEEIRNIYQPVIAEVRTCVDHQTGTAYWKVSYETHVSGDILSVVIAERMAAGDSVYYRGFNLDLTTGQLLGQDEMIRRCTGMTYPEFLLRANYSIVNYLRKEYPMEMEEVTNWLARLAADPFVMCAHKIFVNDDGTLLLNNSVRDWIGFQRPLLIPFDPNACGEEFTDWELGSYRWLFGIQSDGAGSTMKGYLLEKTFFIDPERFLRYLSGSEYWIADVAHKLVFDLNPENAPLLRELCKQYLSRSNTAKAAQAILDQMEKYADYY